MHSMSEAGQLQAGLQALLHASLHAHNTQSQPGVIVLHTCCCTTLLNVRTLYALSVTVACTT